MTRVRPSYNRQAASNMGQQQPSVAISSHKQPSVAIHFNQVPIIAITCSANRSIAPTVLSNSRISCRWAPVGGEGEGGAVVSACMQPRVEDALRLVPH